jgi:hypothetical protein
MVVPSVADMATVEVVETLSPIRTFESWPTRMLPENAGTPWLLPICNTPLWQSKSTLSRPMRAPSETTSRLFDPVNLIWMFCSIDPE